MKKYKKYLIPLMIVVLISVFALPSFALSSVDNFKAFCDSFSSLFVTRYDADSGAQLSTTFKWKNNDTIIISGDSTLTNCVSASAIIGNDNTSSWSVSEGDILKWSASEIYVTVPYEVDKSMYSSAQLNLSIYFNSSASYQPSLKPSTIFPVAHSNSVVSGKTYGTFFFEIDYEGVVPTNSVSLNQVRFKINLPAYSASENIEIGSFDYSFYIGSGDSVPVVSDSSALLSSIGRFGKASISWMGNIINFVMINHTLLIWLCVPIFAVAIGYVYKIMHSGKV